MESRQQDIDSCCGQLSRSQSSATIGALEKKTVFRNCSLKDRGWNHTPTGSATPESDGGPAGLISHHCTLKMLFCTRHSGLPYSLKRC